MNSLCWEVNLLFLAWSDIDRVLTDVSEADATEQIGGGSSFAWTLAHITNGIDSWINVRFLNRQPHPLLSRPAFALGSDGAAGDWQAIRQAVHEARRPARTFLMHCSSSDLERTVPYDGSHPAFRKHGLNLRMAILQNAIHHIYHLGEIATKREWMGHAVDVFPDSLIEMSRDQHSLPAE